MIGAFIGFVLLVLTFHDMLSARTARAEDRPADATYHLLRAIIWVIALTSNWGLPT